MEGIEFIVCVNGCYSTQHSNTHFNAIQNNDTQHIINNVKQCVMLSATI
jgi:hypothetical protein